MASTSSGKTALITGASSGIGYELAKCFARDHHDLVLVARSEDELEQIGLDLHAAHGIRTWALPFDLFDPDAPQQIHDKTRELGLTINYLVCDAGQGVYGKFAETDLRRELDIVELNICSMLALTKLYLREMVARNEGRILQLASIVSTSPAPWSAVYGGTKAFVYYFSEAVARELKGTNVTMTALRPGATDTDFFRKEGGEDATVYQDGKLAAPDQVARDGYAAMMEGQAAVVSGLKNKLMDKMGNLFPEPMAARQMEHTQQPKHAS
jgi:short-subunit dehydrogenase